MQGSARHWLIAELLLCFVPCAVLLSMGVLTLPLRVIDAIEEPLMLDQVVASTLLVGCGLIGFWSLRIVAAAVLAGKPAIDGALCVLGGALLGLSTLVVQTAVAMGSIDDTRWLAFLLTVGLPLIASIHLLVLSRAQLVAGYKHSRRLPAGAYIIGGAIAGLLGWLLILHAGMDAAALEKQWSRWQRHRPAAYLYYASAEGSPETRNFLWPKQIRVVGARVVGASYAFLPPRSDPRVFPEPMDGTWSIDDLYQALMTARKNGARVRARFDAQSGAVLRAYVEDSAEGADWRFAVDGLRPIDPELARRETPRFLPRAR